MKESLEGWPSILFRENQQLLLLLLFISIKRYIQYMCIS